MVVALMVLPMAVVPPVELVVTVFKLLVAPMVPETPIWAPNVKVPAPAAPVVLSTLPVMAPAAVAVPSAPKLRVPAKVLARARVPVPLVFRLVAATAAAKVAVTPVDGETLITLIAFEPPTAALTSVVSVVVAAN